jgi:zinc transporter 9
MATSSRTAVVSALLGNGLLTVIKAVAFLLSGSGAMLAEAIHSLADTSNQALLYLGIRRSERPPDRAFPYGYGEDRYFYSLMSAVGIFVLGCGVTVYHGVEDLLHPPELSLSWTTFSVLGLALVIEGWVLALAVRAVWAKKGEETFFRHLRGTSDPTVLAVLLEDTVACVGVLVAVAGIGLSALTGNPTYDAVGAIVIGLLLGAVAVLLVIKNRALLLGPAIPKHLEEEVVEYLQGDPAVGRIRGVRTRVVGADEFRLQAQIDFDGAYLGARLADLVLERRAEIDGPEAAEALARDFGERLLDELANEVDRIERDLASRFPRFKYVDLEAD